MSESKLLVDVEKRGLAQFSGCEGHGRAENRCHVLSGRTSGGSDLS